MKKIHRIIFFISLSIVLSSNVKAQLWSAETFYSPSTSTQIGNASRLGYHNNNWSTFYMRYNDSAYFCGTLNYSIWNTVPAAYKVKMPQDFVITDFKKGVFRQGFIGSYQGTGMYGLSYGYSSTTTNNYFQITKFTAVNQLNRIATVRSSAPGLPDEMKAFAIGDRISSIIYPKRSVILEFYAEGVNVNAPYYFAPLAYDPITNQQEIADDVITLSHYVVFVTRDTRAGHAPINLRISDTNNALINTDIDYQYQLLLPINEQLIGELRLVSLLYNDFFILTYIVYNQDLDKYFLCVNRIILHDFLAGNNTIVSHEMIIEYSDLVDVIYEPDVRTLVVLLNGSNNSEIYHLNPFSTNNDVAFKLGSPDAFFYSLDTIGFGSTNADMYIATGDNEIFCQDISNGMVIDTSCLAIDNIRSVLRIPPMIRVLNDPVVSNYENKQMTSYLEKAVIINGVRTCVEYLGKNGENKTN